MGKTSATSVAGAFNWPAPGKNNPGFTVESQESLELNWAAGFKPAEWLHRVGYSYGGLGETLRQPGTSQTMENLMFGTSEANSVMCRYEVAYQSLIRVEAELRGKHQEVGLSPMSLKTIANDPDVPIHYIETPRQEQSKFRPVYIFRNEAARDNFFNLPEISTTQPKTNKLNDQWDTEPHKIIDSSFWPPKNNIPWLTYSMRYNLTTNINSQLYPSCKFEHTIYPFQRRFFTSLEANLDKALLHFQYYKALFGGNIDKAVETVLQEIETGKTARITEVQAVTLKRENEFGDQKPAVLKAEEYQELVTDNNQVDSSPNNLLIDIDQDNTIDWDFDGLDDLSEVVNSIISIPEEQPPTLETRDNIISPEEKQPAGLHTGHDINQIEEEKPAVPIPLFLDEDLPMENSKEMGNKNGGRSMEEAGIDESEFEKFGRNINKRSGS